MSFYDHMIMRFESLMGTIGYDNSGYLLVDRYPDIDRGSCPVMFAIDHIQNPAEFGTWFRQAAAGDPSHIGKNDGIDDAGLEITATGVHAEINIGMETYEQELTFAEFAPILEVWEKAWAAAQAYKATLPTR